MAKVTMPQLGESVAEGTIGRWLKKPGDRVEKYEPIVEVVTDKVNAELGHRDFRHGVLLRGPASRVSCSYASGASLVQRRPRLR